MLRENDDIYLDENDFLLLYERNHPVQLEVIKRFNIEPVEIMVAPQPYMGCLDKAHFVYREGSGKYGKGYAIGETIVDENKSWFWTHFIGDPIMAGTLGTDGYLQTGFLWGFLTGKVPGRARALSGSFKFRGQVFPFAKKIYYRADIKKFYEGKRTLVWDGYLALDDPQNIIYTFGETIGGWFYGHELGLKDNNPLSYYNPDWEFCRNEMLKCIDRAEQYYRGLQK